MREFIFFSSRARTSGNFHDLMEAGRMDIVCNVIIASFFISNNIRKDLKLHLIFGGPPDPQKHLIFQHKEGMPISKKDVAGLIKRMLFKCKPGRLTEVFPGCEIEKKSFQEVIREIEKQNKKIYLLDEKGEDIREVTKNKSKEELNNSVFILGDHEGMKKEELQFLKKRTSAQKISISPLTLFASQTLVILHNELDRKGI
jgi:tRNA (pseudouridine54-N1)-methyltransferase